MTKKEQIVSIKTIYLAGGCLWGVQEFLKHIPGVMDTLAGRANGFTQSTKTDYDGFAECVKTVFDASQVSIDDLIHCFLEIIDPYSVNKQGNDIGEKYRTGIYSADKNDLLKAKQCIQTIEQTLNDKNKTTKKVAIEVLPLTNFVPSDAEHQDRLTLHPSDYSYCHIPLDILYKYKNSH